MLATFTPDQISVHIKSSYYSEGIRRYICYGHTTGLQYDLAARHVPEARVGDSVIILPWMISYTL